MAKRFRRVMSAVSSACSVTVRPRQTESLVKTYSGPTAVIRGVRAAVCSSGMYIVSVVFSETVRPNAADAPTIISIVLVKPGSDRDTIPASSAYSMALHCRHHLRGRFLRIHLPLPAMRPCQDARGRPRSPPLHHKRCRATVVTTAKEMLNICGESEHLWKEPLLQSKPL